MRERYSRNFCLPNYTPRKWWECDVFEVTASGYFREYEIKISRGDFRADAKKASQSYNWATDVQTTTLKHEQIGKPHGPRQFWYVCPENLIEIDEVPSWSGLIWVRRSKQSSRIFEEEKKAAPRLHSEKLPMPILEHARSCCYYRLHTSYQRRVEQQPDNVTDDQILPVEIVAGC